MEPRIETLSECVFNLRLCGDAAEGRRSSPAGAATTSCLPKSGGSEINTRETCEEWKEEGGALWPSKHSRCFGSVRISVTVRSEPHRSETQTSNNGEVIVFSYMDKCPCKPAKSSPVDPYEQRRPAYTIRLLLVMSSWISFIKRSQEGCVYCFR